MGLSKKLDNTNNLKTKYPDLCKDWHPKNLQNPEEFFPGSHKKVWWLCSKNIQHEWECAIEKRVLGNKCPFCSNQKVHLTNCLQTTYPDVCNDWDYDKNIIKPNEIKNTDKKIQIFWKCNIKNEHQWSSTVAHKIKYGCLFCKGIKVDSESCLLNTHAELCLDWDPTNEISPSTIKAGSGKKVKWICPINKNHKYKAIISSRALVGTGCPYCSKPSSDMEILYLNSFNIPNENRNKNLKINEKRICPDGHDLENKIIYEFYGDFWHGNPDVYNPNDINFKNKKSFGELYKNTIERKKFIEDAGWKVIFIWENDWLKTPENKEKLAEYKKNKISK